MCDLTDPIFQDENKAREYLEAQRWPDGPVCPHCGSTDASHLTGKSHRPGLYQCNACRQQFTVTVGTVFERSKIPLHKWLLATRLMASSKKGFSAHQLHRTIGVTYKTAWFMAHRIREAMKDDDPGPMGGRGKIIEADETYTGPGEYKFVNKKGWQKIQGLGHKYKVVTLVERDGSARSFHVDRVTSHEVRDILVKNAHRKSTLVTDEASIYKTVGREFHKHWSVNHSIHQWAIGKWAHTNTIEGFFSIFKRGMKGIYQHCGEKHLGRYLAEFDFRYNTRKLDDTERANLAIKGADGKRLTYRRVGVGAY